MTRVWGSRTGEPVPMQRVAGPRHGGRTCRGEAAQSAVGRVYLNVRTGPGGGSVRKKTTKRLRSVCCGGCERSPESLPAGTLRWQRRPLHLDRRALRHPRLRRRRSARGDPPWLATPRCLSNFWPRLAWQGGLIGANALSKVAADSASCGDSPRPAPTGRREAVGDQRNGCLSMMPAPLPVQFRRGRCLSTKSHEVGQCLSTRLVQGRSVPVHEVGPRGRSDSNPQGIAPTREPSPQ
jgi:hypothetical protein